MPLPTVQCRSEGDWRVAEASPGAEQQESEQPPRTGPPACPASAGPDAGTEEFPHGGGSDRRNRTGGEDQEGAIQGRQAGRDEGHNAGNLASRARGIIGKSFNRRSKTDRIPPYIKIAPEPLFGEGAVRKATAEFIAHYHTERNHQGLDNALICPDPGHAVTKAKCIGANVWAGY